MTGRRAEAIGVTVRHYCQGIGDCHLLRFPSGDGADFWMLIDCGVHSAVPGGAAKIKQIVADIASRTDRLDVVVVTHEHWDHVSGFLTEASAFRPAIEVGEVWMAWTEDPDDRQAQALDKFKRQALAALQVSTAQLDGTDRESFLGALGFGLGPVIGFNFGLAGERVRAARDAAKALAPGHVRYFDPATSPPLILPAVPGVRIYVLGPPRDPKLLGLTSRAGELYGLATARAMASAFGVGDGAAGGQDYAAPFDPSIGTGLSKLHQPAGKPPTKGSVEAFARARYFDPLPTGRRPADGGDDPAADQSWRRIDLDWLGASATLAMQLDDHTNNTSLVLAFEFVESRRVLLFAADAQLGSWLSWPDLRWKVGGADVTGADLLGRTVYLKVGHHGSENATPRAKGLELMTDRDLAAFIPTNAEDARTVGWGRMPFEALLDALRVRTSGRVIRADDTWIGGDGADPAFQAPSGVIRDLRHGRGLWVELDLA